MDTQETDRLDTDNKIHTQGHILAYQNIRREKMGYARQIYDYDYCDMYEDDVHPEVARIEKKMDHAADHLKGLIEELTGKAPVDLNAIYFYLGNMCDALNVSDEFPVLSIERTVSPLTKILGE